MDHRLYKEIEVSSEYSIKNYNNRLSYLNQKKYYVCPLSYSSEATLIDLLIEFGLKGIEVEIIDNIERNIFTSMGIHLIIHFDPIVTDDSRVFRMRSAVADKVKQLDKSLTIHDMRLVIGPTHTNVLFDLVFPAGFKGDIPSVVKTVEQYIKELDDKNIPKIKVEQSYTC